MFLGIVLILWPAGLLKLTFVKAYVFMAYLALIRKSPWGNVTFAETWRLRFTHSPWEWILVAAAVVLYASICPPKTRRRLFPVAVYAGLMLLVLLRVNTDTPRYMLPFLPAMHLLAGFTFASVLMRWKPVARASAAAAICALLLWNTVSQVRAHPILPAPRLAAVLASLRDRNLNGKRLLAPQDDLPMIHYYFRKSARADTSAPKSGNPCWRINPLRCRGGLPWRAGGSQVTPASASGFPNTAASGAAVPRTRTAQSSKSP